MQLILRWFPDDDVDDGGAFAAATWHDDTARRRRFAGFYPLPAAVVDELITRGAELDDDGAWQAVVEIEHMLQLDTSGSGG